MGNQFVHLHAHTSSGSLLDGLAHIPDMVAEAKRLGQPAIAVTDHGTLHGAVELYSAARKADIKSIIGIESYVAPGGTSRHGRDRIFFGSRNAEDRIEGSNDVSGRGSYTHMILLAENNEGLSNLFKLSSLSYLEGQLSKPRIDLEILAEYSKGLIGTTGCPSGDIQTRLRLGQFDEAVSYAAQMQEILGKENYFLELMDHSMSINLERGVRGDLLRLAKKLDIPLLATNDLHYTKREDSVAHEQMLAVQTRSLMSELPDYKGGKRFAFEGAEYYVKSREEMERVFPDLPEALDNTLLIAERCNISFDEGADLRPRIGIPEGYSEAQWLRQETFAGLSRRLPDKANDPVYIERVNNELSVLDMKGYNGYILVVSDFVRWAKDNNVAVGAGRGSAAGSLVAFCTDITDADPIRHGLLFERFINPSRDSPPDIDMDFDDVSRPRVIEYVTEKYGADRVAQIATFTKVKAKTAIKDAQKILEQPYALANELTKAFPAPVQGRELPLYSAYDPQHERYNEAEPFRALVEEKGAQEIIDVARGLEGVTRSTGMHAAGIIMSNKPLIDAIPLMTRKDSGVLITQFDYPTCESLGLLKVDFLGLRNLTVMRLAIENIAKRHDITIDLRELWAGPMDDPKTYELLARGETLGVFQLDGVQMRELLKRIVPTNFDDISAVIALYRPGPMGVNAHNDYADRKNDRQPVKPIHPELEEGLQSTLGDTYGLIVYQEQVMQAAQRLAGYTLAEADNLRRAMGKKKRSVLEAEYVNFEAGMKKNNYSSEAIKTLWDVLVPFADYAFNKSHSVGYGYISYATAYLKANYPAEYMAALLTSVDDPIKVALYLNECRRMGIKVLPPDISLSEADYTAVDDTTVLFGLGAVRGLGDETAKAIVDSRGTSGTFISIGDFLEKAPRSILNKRVLDGLIESGAFDSFEYSRKALIEQLPDLAKGASTIKRKEEEGQDSLFSVFDEDEEAQSLFEVNIVNSAEHSKREKLRRERHALGLYVSDHPLSGMQAALGGHSSALVAEILSGEVRPVEGFADKGPKTRIAGVVTSVTLKTTKAGDRFAVVDFEDMTGSMEVVFFPKTYNAYSSMIQQDEICVITGTVKARGTGTYQENEDGTEEEVVVPNMIAESFEILDVDDAGRVPVWFRLSAEQATAQSVEALRKVLARHPGQTPVRLSMREPDGSIAVIELPDALAVQTGLALISEIRELFGISAIGRWR